MSREDHVTYNIMLKLKEHNWSIFQYHPPGGQAGMIIKTSLGNVVPDIIGYKNGYVLICENKGKFSDSDVKKLLFLQQDNSALLEIEAFVRKAIKPNIPPSIAFLWGHGFTQNLAIKYLSNIGFLQVAQSGQVTDSNFPIKILEI